MTQAKEAFLTRWRELTLLGQMSALLGWDQQTGMPSAAAAGRGEQSALLGELQHRRLTDPAWEEIFAALERDADGLETAQLQEAKRLYERQKRVPLAWETEFTRVVVGAYSAWEKAREASRFADFEAHLTRIVELRRQYAGFFPEFAHPYDTLLTDYEPGLTTARITGVFTPLRTAQVELLREILARQKAAKAFAAPFPTMAQLALSKQAMQWVGLEAGRCRLDQSPHPFTDTAGYDDVRITTNLDEENPTSLFSTLHESGHALYELNIDPALRDTPLGTVNSLALHESQSRMWENIIGRSRAWSHFMFPTLQGHFPAALTGFDAESWYRAVNIVQPGLIRVDADEVTYNLHIMLRFELEVALMTGELAVCDLEEAWNAKMKEYLDVDVPDAAHGVLQDVHWAGGSIGYFPTYALGNLIGAQIFETVRDEFPDTDERLARGETAWLAGWLREQLHRHGARYSAWESVERITGKALSATPYLNYLRNKFLADHN